MYVDKICPKGKESFFLSLLSAYLRNTWKEELFFALLEKYRGITPEKAKHYISLGRELAKRKGLSNDYVKEHYTKLNFFIGE